VRNDRVSPAISPASNSQGKLYRARPRYSPTGKVHFDFDLNTFFFSLSTVSHENHSFARQSVAEQEYVSMDTSIPAESSIDGSSVSQMQPSSPGAKHRLDDASDIRPVKRNKQDETAAPEHNGGRNKTGDMGRKEYL
jgi:hypothetical protein